MIQLKELQQLVDAGLISDSQSQSIQHYQASQKTSSEWWFSHSIMTIGAILIGLWILSLIALNREEMSDIVKILISLSSMTVSYLSGRYFKTIQKSLLWGTLLFLSGLLCGATIFLIAQIYNLTVTNDILLGIRIFMILPLVYFLKQKEFYRLYMILLSCVIAQFLMSHVFVSTDERTIFVLYILFWLAMVLIGLIHEYYYDDTLLAKLYKTFGANITMIAYGIFIIMSDNVFYGMSDTSLSYHFPIPVVAMLVMIWLGYILCYIWKKDIRFLWWCWVFFVLLFAVEIADFPLINYGIFIAICVMLIFLWHQAHNSSIVKTANVYLYLFLLYLYGKYGREYENKALFFIIGWVLMIGLGLGFSKLNTLVEKGIKG